MFDRSSHVDRAPLSARSAKLSMAATLLAALSLTACGGGADEQNPGGNESIRCSSWGKNGEVDTPLPSAKGSPDTMLVGADGMVFVAGHTGYLFEIAPVVTVDMMIVRYQSDGSLDTSYGEEGVVWFVNDTNTEIIESAVAWADGSIAVGGAAYGTEFSGLFASHDGFLARLTPAGTLDAAFGDQGFLRFQTAEKVAFAKPVAAQEGGKLVAMVAAPEGKLVRYGPDGGIDASFGVAGETVVPSFAIYDTAEAPDGRLLIAGIATDGPKVLRFTADGAVDTTFGAAGAASLAGPIDSMKIAVGPGGDVFVFSKHFTADGSEYGLVRVDTDGATSTEFAVDITKGGHFFFIHDLTVDSQGHPALVGLTEDADAVVKYLPDGGVDTSFGQNGLVNPASNSVTMAPRGQGELLVTGEVNLGNEAFRVTCFNP